MAPAGPEARSLAELSWPTAEMRTKYILRTDMKRYSDDGWGVAMIGAHHGLGGYAIAYRPVESASRGELTNPGVKPT